MYVVTVLMYTYNVYSLQGNEGGVYLSEGTYGIVYIEHNGVLGTICDDVFDSNDNACQVICGQMGYA